VIRQSWSRAQKGLAFSAETTRRRLTSWSGPLLFGWFVLLDILAIVKWLLIDAFGGNVQTYHAAAKVWLAGGDPWGAEYLTTFGGQRLIAPPPSLAPYVLTAWLPVGSATWVWVGAGAVAAILVIRRLRLPLWWVLFPPLVFDVFWGSADPILLLFLVVGPRWVAGAVKATFIPAMIAERAWRDLSVVFALLALSLVVLPWRAFLSHLPELVAAAQVQSEGGTSAATYLPLAIATVVALIVIGWRRGWYMAVPVLWPANQVGYAVVSLPVLGSMPLMAAAVAIPLPYLGAVAIIATAFVSPRSRSGQPSSGPEGQRGDR
jgi:hypothetical protein